MKTSKKPNYNEYTLSELYQAEESVDREKYPKRYDEIHAKIQLRNSTKPNYDEYTLKELYEAESSVNREKYPERYQEIRARIKKINKLANSDYTVQNHRLTEKLMNPWTSIWLKPRATIEQIIASGNSGVRLIILFFGVTFGISSALKDAENLQEIFFNALATVIMSPIVTIILLFVIGSIIHWIGKKLGGKASRVQIYTVLAWSSLPLIGAALFEIVLTMMVFILRANLILTTASYILMQLILALINFITAIWAFVILVNCLKQVQDFSMGKAIMSALSIPMLSLVLSVFILSIK